MPSKKSTLPKITIHTIVKNEDRWIWYALNSVLPYAEKILIYDTGSTDKTIPIINTLDSPKIILETKIANSREDLVKLRQEQLNHTTTPWFMLLDGDEIWPQKNLQKLLNKAASATEHTVAFFTRTRNCVGDIYHYLPESTGHYQIKDVTGHLNTRLIRNNPRIRIIGEYPLETYTIGGSAIQDLGSGIQFVDTWYLHATHLRRSSQTESSVIDRLQKRKFRLGLKMPKQQLPAVFWQPRPAIVPPPITNRWKQLWQNLF